MTSYIGDGFRADIDELRAIGHRANEVGSDLGNTIHSRARALGSVAQHGQWAISSALNHCAEGWERELTSTSRAVQQVGDKLAASADHYSDIDGTHRDQLNSILPSIGRSDAR